MSENNSQKMNNPEILTSIFLIILAIFALGFLIQSCASCQTNSNDWLEHKNNVCEAVYSTNESFADCKCGYHRRNEYSKIVDEYCIAKFAKDSKIEIKKIVCEKNKCFDFIEKK